jgi:hypothetical protein
MTKESLVPQQSQQPLNASIVRGGLLHDMLERLGLMAPDGLPTLRVAIGLALIAWLAPVTLASVQSSVDESYSGARLFTDWTVHTRYLVAIFVMIVTERYADGRFDVLLRQFRSTDLVPPASDTKFNIIIRDADRWTSSRLAEIGLLALALILPGLSTSYVVAVAGTSWEGAVVAGEIRYSWAGLAARYFSTPLFHFLMLRWIWRFVVWMIMLLRVSRLPLQLLPLHPDRSAGVGFLAIYPSVFSGFVFALSSVIAASMVKELGLVAMDPNTVWLLLAAWVLIMLIIFLGPLLVFSKPIYNAREMALLEYGRLANQHHLAFQRKWVDTAANGGDLLGSPEPSSVADLNAALEVLNQIRTFPIDRPAVVQLLVATCVPLLAVVLTLMPLAEVIEKLLAAIV